MKILALFVGYIACQCQESCRTNKYKGSYVCRHSISHICIGESLLGAKTRVINFGDHPLIGFDSSRCTIFLTREGKIDRSACE